MSLIQPPIIYQPFCSTGSQTAPPTTSTGGSDVITNQEDGFTPLQATPFTAGGAPVLVSQMNGVLNFYSSIIEWINAGGTFTFDATFSTQNGGYPAGVILWCDSNKSYQRSLINNNIANFITTPSYINDGINWVTQSIYTPDIIDDVSTGQITIGGRVLNATQTLKTKSTSGKTSFVATTYDNIGSIPYFILYTTENDGVTLNTGLRCYYGYIPHILGNLSTLTRVSNSVMIAQDVSYTTFIGTVGVQTIISVATITKNSINQFNIVISGELSFPGSSSGNFTINLNNYGLGINSVTSYGSCSSNNGGSFFVSAGIGLSYFSISYNTFGAPSLFAGFTITLVTT